MAKVTPGYKLYLYQLLSRHIGQGKQTMIAQVEEVLAADDIVPADLECQTVQELVEACPDFLKLTVFKKGRRYVTVVANPEWDQMLAAPSEKPERSAGKKAPAGGPKTWKKQKSGRKNLKPVKPGKQRREREAAEARAAAERAAREQEERAAQQEELERQAAVAADEAVAAQAAPEPQAGEAGAPQQDAARQADAAPDAPAEPQAAQPIAINEASAEPGQPAGSQPVARTVAEILAEARAAEQAGAADEAPAQASGPDAAPAVEPHPRATDAAPSGPQEEPATDEPDVPEAPTEPSAPSAPEPPATPEAAPISLTITYDPYEDMERELARQASEAEAEAPLQPAPRPPQQPAPAPATQGAPAIPLADLPQSMHAEVSCKDALLRALYQLLPYDVEPLAILDEDWRTARSTGTLSGSRGRVTFPLRYLHDDGTPLTITLRRTARNASGKRWSLALVDGDDGSGTSHDAIGFERLPTADEGAWADLGGTAPDPAASPLRFLTQQVVIGSWDSLLGALSAIAAPERWNYPGEGVGKASRLGILREYVATTFRRACDQDRLAHSASGQFAAFDTGLSTAFGEDVYACLTARTGDIPWQFAGFATAGSGELGGRLVAELGELPLPPSYLHTLEDVVPQQGRMVILDTEALLGTQLGRLPHSFLAEQTEGLDEAQAILQAAGALPAADITHLGRAIKAHPATYRRLRRTLDDAVEQAMRSVRASYRLAAPVWDPADGRTKLLVPLCLVEDGHADCALVLDLQPSGAYRAAAVLSLPRAYACARVVSREQPRWLAPDEVL